MRRNSTPLVTLIGITLLIGLARVPTIGVRAYGAFPPKESNGRSAPRVFMASDKGVTPPVPIYKPEPSPKTGKVQGKVLLFILVQPDGTVGDVEILGGPGDDMRQRAVDTVKTWKFKPATKDGNAVPCKIMAELTFWKN